MIILLDSSSLAITYNEAATLPSALKKNPSKCRKKASKAKLNQQISVVSVLRCVPEVLLRHITFHPVAKI